VYQRVPCLNFERVVVSVFSLYHLAIKKFLGGQRQGASCRDRLSPGLFVSPLAIADGSRRLGNGVEAMAEYAEGGRMMEMLLSNELMSVTYRGEPYISL
jgi:hypothetical protein